MGRLLWAFAGFLGGIAVARNATTMSMPERSAVFLVGLLLAGLTFYAGWRDKKTAIASAVSIAVAHANATAEANAQAIANQTVHVNYPQLPEQFQTWEQRQAQLIPSSHRELEMTQTRSLDTILDSSNRREWSIPE